MAESLAPIRVSERISSVQKQVAAAAARVTAVRERLIRCYAGSKILMGESGDLAVFEEKFDGGMDALQILAQTLEQFSENLGTAAAGYRKAQEAAIARAAMIPK